MTAPKREGWRLEGATRDGQSITADWQRAVRTTRIRLDVGVHRAFVAFLVGIHDIVTAKGLGQ